MEYMGYALVLELMEQGLWAKPIVVFDERIAVRYIDSGFDIHNIRVKFRKKKKKWRRGSVFFFDIEKAIHEITVAVNKERASREEDWMRYVHIRYNWNTNAKDNDVQRKPERPLQSTQESP